MRKCYLVFITKYLLCLKLSVKGFASRDPNGGHLFTTWRPTGEHDGSEAG